MPSSHLRVSLRHGFVAASSQAVIREVLQQAIRIWAITTAGQRGKMLAISWQTRTLPECLHHQEESPASALEERRTSLPLRVRRSVWFSCIKSQTQQRPLTRLNISVVMSNAIAREGQRSTSRLTCSHFTSSVLLHPVNGGLILERQAWHLMFPSLFI